MMGVFSDQSKLVRIVLYCHNRDGLGHIIRSVRIAEGLLATNKFEPVLLTGCRSIDAIAIPAGLSIETLTPIPADPYDPNKYKVVAERINQIKDCMTRHSPDILLVDTLPFGYMRELKSILDHVVNNRNNSPVCVLGLPYSGHDIQNLSKNINDRATFSAYTHGMIYSDDEHEDGFENITFPLTKTGIIAGTKPPEPDPLSRIILVLAGGGTVSLSLLDPVARATAKLREEGFNVRFITGPLADHNLMAGKTTGMANFELVAECTVEEAVRDAKIVIARCGYNTAATLARTSLPVIFIPHCYNEKDEQYRRAQNLCKLKNIVMADPLHDDIPAKLEQELYNLLDAGLEDRATSIRFTGVENAVKYLSQIVEETIASQRHLMP